MEASHSLMKQRWGFLAPWLASLTGRIEYRRPGNNIEDWDAKGPRLEVILPTRANLWDKTDELGKIPKSDEEEFTVQLQKVREGLALLAAVAHVDHAAWKYLLRKYCRVDFGKEGAEHFESKTPARFWLIVDLKGKNNKKYQDKLDFDLVQFCGIHQRGHPSCEYLIALSKIAALDVKLKPDNPGVDIEIPVRVRHVPTVKSIGDIMENGMDYATAQRILAREKSVENFTEILTDIQTAESVICEQWDEYKQSSLEQDVMPGSLRCTFVIEPIAVQLNAYVMEREIMKTIRNLVLSNVWFSALSMWLHPDTESEAEDPVSRKSFGQLMGSLFDSTRRSPALAHTTYHCGHSEPSPESSPELRPLQLGTIGLVCHNSLRKLDFEMMCSAMVVNQTSKKLVIGLQMVSFSGDNYDEQYWQWLAYAIFSKRARENSALESLALLRIASMTTADIEGFEAVLQSDHPEEYLFDSPRGQIDERDAVLKSGGSIRWQFDDEGQPILASSTLSFPSPTRSVRTFSDDGTSKWVNVLVPGYGRCQVLRGDLIFDQSRARRADLSGVTSLTIAFDMLNTYQADSLPRFLALVGHSLKYLTLHHDLGVELVSDLFLESCPNLEELVIRGDMVAARFNFSEYHTNGQAVSALSPPDWSDVASLSELLCDADNPLAKCLRRLRISTPFVLEDPEDVIRADHLPRIEADLKTLLEMLEKNKTLEYLDVVAPTEFSSYLGKFRKHHLEPINGGIKLSMESKIAFLSVLRVGRNLTEPSRKRKREASCFGLVLCDLDPHMISNIFSFAAPPVCRHVYFRSLEGPDYWWSTRDETAV